MGSGEIEYNPTLGLGALELHVTLRLDSAPNLGVVHGGFINAPLTLTGLSQTHFP